MESLLTTTSPTVLVLGPGLRLKPHFQQGTDQPLCLSSSTHLLRSSLQCVTTSSQCGHMVAGGHTRRAVAPPLTSAVLSGDHLAVGGE